MVNKNLRAELVALAERTKALERREETAYAQAVVADDEPEGIALSGQHLVHRGAFASGRENLHTPKRAQRNATSGYGNGPAR